MIRSLPALAAACLICQTVTAQDAHGVSHYASVGWTEFSYDSEAIPDDVNGGLFMLQFGHRYNPWAAIETRLGIGVTEGDVARIYNSFGIIQPTPGVELEMDYLVGVYGKFNLLGSQMISPYVLAGYSVNKSTISYRSTSASTSERGLSFGAGIDFCGDRICASVEVSRYLEGDQLSLDGLTASLTCKY